MSKRSELKFLSNMDLKTEGKFYLSVSGNVVVMNKKMFFDKDKATDMLFVISKMLSDTIQSSKSVKERREAAEALQTLCVLPVMVM